MTKRQINVTVAVPRQCTALTGARRAFRTQVARPAQGVLRARQQA